MKYEYLIERIPGGSRMSEDRLNELGSQGYELVHVTSNSKEFIFKKQARATRSKKADA